MSTDAKAYGTFHLSFNRVVSYKPGHPQEDVDKFTKKLIAAREAIFSDAQGRTCGKCQSYRNGRCMTQVNIKGHALAILYDTAPACRYYIKSKKLVVLPAVARAAAPVVPLLLPDSL